jgi:hypothetical protein
LGLDIQSEIATSVGRIDLTLITPKYIYILEFKFNKPAQEALQQIQDKRYYEKYLSSKKELILIGVSFNYKNKQLELEWTNQLYDLWDPGC